MEVVKTLDWPQGVARTEKRISYNRSSYDWYEVVGKLITICKKMKYHILYITMSNEKCDTAVTVICKTPQGTKLILACDKYFKRTSNLLYIVRYLESDYKVMQYPVVCMTYPSKINTK